MPIDDILLSDHFTLREMTRTAVRNEPNEPGAEDIVRLRVLCVSMLEPLRKMFGPLYVDSGYRSLKINALIGGAIESAHTYGCAADVVPVALLASPVRALSVTIDNMAEWFKNGSLVFDQVIAEHKGEGHWLHVAMLRPNHEAVARKEVLIFKDGNYAAL